MFIGFLVLVRSTLLSFKLFPKILNEQTGKLWKLQTYLMMFFALTYLFVFGMLLQGHDNLISSLVFFIFLCGSIFVFITVFVTTKMVKGLVKKREDLEIELSISEKKLIETKKIAALGSIADATAHEINNPLTIMLGYADLISRKFKSGDLTLENLEDSQTKIKEAGSRIKETIDDFQQYSTHNHIASLEEVNLPNLVSESVEFLKLKSKRENINFAITTPDNIMALCNKNKMSNLLIELFENAFFAMKNREEQKTIFVSIYEIEDTVRLRVKNTGPLVPHAAIDKIFDPFFTTKDFGEGRGVGLSTAKATMISQGGDIHYLIEENFPCFELIFSKNKTKVDALQNE